jgi:hypothetical protein
MLRLCWVLLLILFSSETGQAQEIIPRFDKQTIDNSLKCELSQVARALRPHKVPPARLRAKVESAYTDTRNTGGGFKLEFPFQFFPSAEAKAESKDVIGRVVRGTRNIHVDNSVNCHKRNVVNLGIYECFRDALRDFVGGDSIDCTREKTATGSANANFRVQIWVVNAGPTGSYSVTRTWKVAVTAPPL